MTNKAAMLILKGASSELEVDKQKKVEECTDKFRALLKEYEPESVYALALVAMEADHDGD